MKLFQTTLALTLLISTSLIAQETRVLGTVSHKITNQSIQFLRFKVSKQEKARLAAKAKEAVAHPGLSAFAASKTKVVYPERILLGMHEVPVLNQGSHGSCVTFAVTAAIDAALQKGDYISQLCQLQLGNYLAEHGYGMSGWEGSSTASALAQMTTFGFVNKNQEAAVGCGGLTEYPLEGKTPSASMSLEEFHRLSEPFMEAALDISTQGISWSTLLDPYDAILDRVDTDKVLAHVKGALMANDRVIFAIFLPAIDLGVAGAIAEHQVANDTWVLTPEIARDLFFKPLADGHTMVITGYDDNAEAIDNTGQKHYGLLSLRNSWGTALGDQGNFYMSYDYFKTLVVEAYRIRTL